MITEVITDAELAEARELQNMLMVDELHIERRDGVTEGEFSNTPAWSTIYRSRGRLQADRRQAGLVDLAGRLVRPSGYVGAIPWNGPTLQQGDKVTVTRTANPDVSESYTIKTVERGSTLVTAKRFTCEEA